MVLDKRNPIKVEDAIDRVMKWSQTGAIEWVDLEKAYGRFLGEDLIADHDVPHFDRSPYDGYALKAEDTRKASRETPIILEVVGVIGAGSLHKAIVQSGEAVRIMTGAQIPVGCNAIVMLELTDSFNEEGRDFVKINRVYQEGDNISVKGEDTKEGSVLAKKGSYINPGIMALLATFGYKQVPVSVKPRIGVLATGSELLDVGDDLQPGKIRNSNAYMILSQIERAGGNAVYLGQFADDFDVCYKQVQSALEEVDFLITTGGVSVGDYDYLPEIYEEMEASVLFNKIGMRPGSVTTVAEKNGKLLFGLSGNPSACYVGFELLTRPVIRKFLHTNAPYLQSVSGILGSDFKKPNPFTRFVRATIEFENGRLIAFPSGLDKSSAVVSLATTNALIVLEGGTRGFEKGMEIQILLLENQEGQKRFSIDLDLDRILT